LTKSLHQAGVIAYRAVHGQVQVQLITSRDTGRWIIPKGNISVSVSPSRAAETEAYEEAGVKGEVEGGQGIVVQHPNREARRRPLATGPESRRL
jgi:predicted NUDIX family NTP pyrophosphohydrolase